MLWGESGGPGTIALQPTDKWHTHGRPRASSTTFVSAPSPPLHSPQILAHALDASRHHTAVLPEALGQVSLQAGDGQTALLQCLLQLAHGELASQNGTAMNIATMQLAHAFMRMCSMLRPRY